MKSKELNELQNKLKKFANDRDWQQFHSPKNLVMALSGEAGELTEHFQWLSERDSYLIDDNETLEEVTHEVADVFLYLVQICEKLDIDLLKAANEKMIINEKKYPIDRSRGSSRKYNRSDST